MNLRLMSAVSAVFCHVKKLAFKSYKKDNPLSILQEQKKWSALHTTPSYKRVKRVAAVEQKKEDSKWEI